MEILFFYLQKKKKKEKETRQLKLMLCQTKRVNRGGISQFYLQNFQRDEYLITLGEHVKQELRHGQQARLNIRDSWFDRQHLTYL